MLAVASSRKKNHFSMRLAPGRTLEVPRGRGGALGGWHESWKDAPSPWLLGS